MSYKNIAREIKLFGAKTNNMRNGIWLPSTKSARVSGSVAALYKEASIYGDTYKQYIFDKLSVANSREVCLTALSGIE